jgi:hypothetical protein
MEIDKDDLNNLVTLLGKLVEKLGDSDKKPVEEQQKTTNKKQSKKRTPSLKTKKQKENFYNKFCDMAESKMHKSDTEIDKKLNRFPPSERTRKYIPVNVVCRVCGRRDQINPSLVDSIERYKCNKCARIPG